MKVLILVQSVDKPDFIRLRQAQQETWDSVEVPDVQTIYYLPGPINDTLEGNTLRIWQDLHWQFMFFTFAKALRHMLKYEWDYIFKTDNSTYVDKAKLHEILSSKPRTKYYGGMSFPFKIDGVHTVDFFWGDGYALSRDMAEHIVQCYNKAPFKGLQEDDIVVAKIMKNVANWDPTLHVQVPMTNNLTIEPGHHVYRVRIDAVNYSPAAFEFDDIKTIIDHDIWMMNQVHDTVLQKKNRDTPEGISLS